MGRLRPLAKCPHPDGETATKGLWRGLVEVLVVATLSHTFDAPGNSCHDGHVCGKTLVYTLHG